MIRQASNRCKRVLEAAKLAYANKTKESINSQALVTFGELPIVFSTKVYNRPEVLSPASDKVKKVKLIAENFSKYSNLDDLGISLPVFPSRMHLKLHNISVTPKIVKKVIMSLGHSMLSGLRLDMTHPRF